MVTIILAIALLVAIAGLAVEIGIASWNIRRAGRYQGRKALAEMTAEKAVEHQQEMAKKSASRDEYASEMFWLLCFLYGRYDKFIDLEKEVNEGLKNLDDTTPIEEVEQKYKDLKKALKIIRVTVKASERMDSIAEQARLIIEDLACGDDEKEPEDEKPQAESSNEEPEKQDVSAD
jgi:hypothetical protein